MVRVLVLEKSATRREMAIFRDLEKPGSTTRIPLRRFSGSNQGQPRRRFTVEAAVIQCSGLDAGVVNKGLFFLTSPYKKLRHH